MDSVTGELFSSRAEAEKAGVPESVLVEVFGSPSAVKSVAEAVKERYERETQRLLDEAREKEEAKARQRKHHRNDHPPKVKK